MSKIICFHHTDLDGIGVEILARLYAKVKEQEIVTVKCDYSTVDENIIKTLGDLHQEEVSEILVGDISPTDKGAVVLHEWSKVVPVRLRDHHATANWLNVYDWAEVHEKTDDIERCGTWLIYQELKQDIESPLVQTFVNEVDNWDTWKWKGYKDHWAKDLNALFQVLGEQDFVKYILQLDIDFIELRDTDQTVTAEDLFNQYGAAYVDAHERQVRKVARSCEEHMWLMDMKLPRKSQTYKTGVVFANHDLSDLAEIILSNHPELDILLIMSLPRSISYRTQKRLDIPLGDVAKMITGSGGGHPQSAGSTISSKQFCRNYKKMLESFSSQTKGIEFNNLRTKE